MGRSYRQYCGLARALDVVGDRWNLLIVRQLLMAPARYGELLEGLPGVATNLLAGRTTTRRSATVGIDVDGQLLQVRATPSGTEVSPDDGRDLDAVVHADASIVLGLAAGVLTLDDTTGLIDIEGDDAAVRAVFNPRRTDAEGPARR